jgi:lactoylglutathione lyase
MGPEEREVAATRIIDVEGVAEPVREQDRALRSYVDKLGSELRRDVPMAGGGRWIQVAPLGATTTIALVAAVNGVPLGWTGITFTASDAQAHHANLLARGVGVDEVLRWPGAPQHVRRNHHGNLP